MHIHIYPDPVLKTEAELVTIINVDIQVLIGDMERLMYENNGIGLAANQVGVPMRIIILNIDQSDKDNCSFYIHHKDSIILINPIIVSASLGEGFISKESCLSLPGFQENIRRYKYICVEGLDRCSKKIEFEASDLLAACIQHEIDHLNGILLISRISQLKRDMYLRRLKKYHKSG